MTYSSDASEIEARIKYHIDCLSALVTAEPDNTLPRKNGQLQEFFDRKAELHAGEFLNHLREVAVLMNLQKGLDGERVAGENVSGTATTIDEIALAVMTRKHNHIERVVIQMATYFRAIQKQGLNFNPETYTFSPPSIARIKAKTGHLMTKRHDPNILIIAERQESHMAGNITIFRPITPKEWMTLFEQVTQEAPRHLRSRLIKIVGARRIFQRPWPRQGQTPTPTDPS